MSFNICHCGFTQDNHSHFRHEYKETALVTKNVSDGKTKFTFSTTSFPEIKKERCSKPNCVALKGFHTQDGHPYTPETYTFREIKLALLGSEKCNKCGGTLKTHHTVGDHSFTTQVCVDKREGDKLVVFYDEDDDVKIILS